MPLNPSDVAYINKLLDRHLKNQRSWPWMRYFGLVMGALMIGIGIWTFSLAGSIARLADFTPLSATRPATTASTLPVTHEEVTAAQASAEMAAKLYAWWPCLLLEFNICGAFVIIIGTRTALWSLARWNHHRRDAILITLLREKCAAELAMPPVVAASST